MEDLSIEAGRDTLAIHCNVQTGTITLEGISYPQDAVSFFEPLLDWLESFTSMQSERLTLEIRINYLNTSSTKCLFDLLDTLEEYHQGKGEAVVNWYYQESDRDIMETGQEFMEDVQLPFNLLPYSTTDNG